MIYNSTVTSKGQMTLPVEFRKKLGIKPGERVTVDLKGDKVIVQKNNWREEVDKIHAKVAAHMKRHDIKPMSIEEMEAEIDRAGQAAAIKRYERSLPQ